MFLHHMYFWGIYTTVQFGGRIIRKFAPRTPIRLVYSTFSKNTSGKAAGVWGSKPASPHFRLSPEPQLWYYMNWKVVFTLPLQKCTKMHRFQRWISIIFFEKWLETSILGMGYSEPSQTRQFPVIKPLASPPLTLCVRSSWIRQIVTENLGKFGALESGGALMESPKRRGTRKVWKRGWI